MATKKKTAKVRRQVRTLTIDKGRWLTGDSGEKESRLLHPVTGRMCCLGFLGRRVGLTEAEIFDHGEPCDIRRKPLWPGWLLAKDGGNSDDTWKLMETNDNQHMTRKRRETLIAKGFARHGIKVRYVGRYPRKKAGQ